MRRCQLTSISNSWCVKRVAAVAACKTQWIDRYLALVISLLMCWWQHVVVSITGVGGGGGGWNRRRGNAPSIGVSLID